MDKNISIKEWQEKYKNGEFSSPDFETQVSAGWYDWFCNTDSLEKKTHFFSKAIMLLKDSSRVSLDNHYVWFKNNCPFDYPLYDDFRIADMKTGEVLYTIVKHDPMNEEKCLWTVYAIKEGLVKHRKYGHPTFKHYSFKTTKQLAEWLNEIK